MKLVEMEVGAANLGLNLEVGVLAQFALVSAQTNKAPLWFRLQLSPPECLEEVQGTLETVERVLKRYPFPGKKRDLWVDWVALARLLAVKPTISAHTWLAAYTHRLLRTRRMLHNCLDKLQNAVNTNREGKSMVEAARQLLQRSNGSQHVVPKHLSPWFHWGERALCSICCSMLQCWWGVVWLVVHQPVPRYPPSGAQLGEL
jgi:hypothetical protein